MRAWMTTMALCAGALLGFAASGCGEETGVCTACCGPTGTTYCKDGWTRAECDDWTNLQVNGLSWSFYPGQTCAERGTPPTP